MNTLRLLGLFAVILIGSGVLVHHFARPEIPTQRVLRDKQGRAQDVKIIGKEKGLLIVESSRSASSHEIPVNSLQLSDRLYTAWLADEEPPQIKGYPVNRTLVSSEGVPLEVRILGKRQDLITVERVSDEARFDLPLARLSDEDRRFAKRLRNSEAPEEPDAPEEPETNYIAIRRASIEDLKNKVELYKKEIASNTLSKNIHEKRVSDLAKIEAEIRSLELAIETYRFRTKAK